MKTIAEQMAAEFVRNFAFDSHCRSKNIIIYRRTYINSQVSKKLTPKVSSWFSKTKDIYSEGKHMIRPI